MASLASTLRTLEEILRDEERADMIRKAQIWRDSLAEGTGGEGYLDGVQDLINMFEQGL